MASNLASIGLWWFVPGFVTGHLQDFYYRLTVRAGEPWPQKGTARWQKHYRTTFTLVILTYLAYTIYESDWQQQRQGDFYQVLGGLPHDVDTNTIRSQMRRFAAKNHPDKVPEGQRARAEEVFVLMRRAADVLSDPVKRFAYDRLGPGGVEYDVGAGLKVTYAEYTKRAMTGMAQTYLGSFIVLLVLGYTNYMSTGRFWRWIIFFSLLVFEATMLTRPAFPGLLTGFVNPLVRVLSFGEHPPLLPFQLLSILRTLSISTNIAFNQLGPFYKHSLSAGQAPIEASEDVTKMFNEQKVGLHYLAQQSAQLLQLELRPFMEDGGEQSIVGESKARDLVKRYLVINDVMKDEGYRRTFEKAAQRLREGRPIEDEEAEEIIVG